VLPEFKKEGTAAEPKKVVAPPQLTEVRRPVALLEFKKKEAVVKVKTKSLPPSRKSKKPEEKVRLESKPRLMVVRQDPEAGTTQTFQSIVPSERTLPKLPEAKKKREEPVEKLSPDVEELAARAFKAGFREPPPKIKEFRVPPTLAETAAKVEEESKCEKNIDPLAFFVYKMISYFKYTTFAIGAGAALSAMGSFFNWLTTPSFHPSILYMGQEAADKIDRMTEAIYLYETIKYSTSSAVALAGSIAFLIAQRYLLKKTPWADTHLTLKLRAEKAAREVRKSNKERERQKKKYDKWVAKAIRVTSRRSRGRQDPLPKASLAKASAAAIVFGLHGVSVRGG